jgi:hypothetical protein
MSFMMAEISGIELLSLQLLRGHVGHRPEDASLFRQKLRSGLAQFRSGILLPQLGQPKVEHLCPALLGDHDVAGLEIAVDDALLVGRGQGIGQGNGDLEDLLEGHAACGDRLRERFTLHQLHGEKASSFILFYRIDVNDVGMVEGRQRPGLAIEPGQSLRIGGELGRQHFECHLAVEGRVLGAVDLSHPAFAELGGELEM